MAYTPHTWSSGDIITAALLNALEQAVAEASAGGNGVDGGYYPPAVSSAGVLSWTASKSDMAAVGSTDLGALIQTYVENAILGGTY